MPILVEVMDPSLFLMLSSLMQLQNTFKPSSSTINNNNVPLLFFMLAAALCYVNAIYSHKTSNSDDDGNDNSYFNATNTNLLLYNNLIIPDRMWALDPHLRDTQFRTTYGLSHPLFAALLEQLKCYIPPYTINMPLHSSLAIVLHSPSQGHGARVVAS